MTKITLNQALDMAKNQKNYFVKGQTSAEVIDKIEDKLGFKLSNQHRMFYSKVGYLSFNGYEFYGVCNDTLTGKDSFCAIETTLKERKTNNLPINWVIFSFLDDGVYAYIDYSRLNNEGEPKIITAIYNGKTYTNVDTISHEIVDFICKHF